MPKKRVGSPENVGAKGRKPDKWVPILERKAEKYGTEMFLMQTWAGRERAFRIKKKFMEGELEVPGKLSEWQFAVETRACRGKETSHDGRMSELHARRRV